MEYPRDFIGSESGPFGFNFDSRLTDNQYVAVVVVLGKRWPNDETQIFDNALLYND